MQKSISNNQYHIQLDIGSGGNIYDLADNEISISITDRLHICNENATHFSSSHINISEIIKKSNGLINSFEEFIKLFEPYEISKTITIMDVEGENKLVIYHKLPNRLYMEFDITNTSSEIIHIS